MLDSEAGIELVIEDAVATLRLNRPEHGNALSLSLVQRFSELAADIDADRKVRAVLLTGTGRFFCVGGDISAFKQSGDGLPSLMKIITGHLHTAMSRLARMEKPLVVAVNGPAAGAGLGLAALGDIVLASVEAHFSMAYTAIGFTPDGGTSALLPRLIGLRRTQEMALTNRRVSAPEATEIGLVTRIVQPDELQVEAHVLARKLAEGPTRAYGAIRQLLLSAPGNGFEAQMELEARLISNAAASADGGEGITAFLGKRRPVFTGV